MHAMSEVNSRDKDGWVYVQFGTSRRLKAEIKAAAAMLNARGNVRMPLLRAESERALSDAAILNAAVVEFLALPLEKQEEILKRTVVAMQDQVMEEMEKLGISGKGSDDSPQVKSKTNIIDDRPAASPRKRKGKPA